jgi:hypothetical protein
MVARHGREYESPRDPSQLGKMIVVIGFGDVEDRERAAKGRAGGLVNGAARRWC